ncbi:ADP-ribosylation factor-like protein 16 [Bicyclus anynana]|uniref:ADP-ribosylation factor-like protein 16 n=1 Tax=Bicyclus anynana TaxID=110368 RepID=A0A6J1NLK6_BICAN|nr:ADP-ribosylation factor-like protein 16 [Bicyclus anynana]
MEDPEKHIPILCLGPKGSGKTTLLKKLQEAEGIDYTYSPVPTIGTNIYDIQHLNKAGKKQVLSIREVGGVMAPLWSNYFEGVEKVIYVVDTSNLCQISATAVLLYTLLAEPKLKKAKFILVLSKMDAAYRQMRNEALLMLQYTRLSNELQNKPILLEVSPLTGTGLDALRTHLAETKRFTPPVN